MITTSTDTLGINCIPEVSSGKLEVVERSPVVVSLEGSDVLSFGDWLVRGFSSEVVLGMVVELESFCVKFLRDIDFSLYSEVKEDELKMVRFSSFDIQQDHEKLVREKESDND
ncbi:MAG: hypothetical protein ACFFE8_01415 [Candidatus Heimdallarchaeota archaeon]